MDPIQIGIGIGAVCCIGIVIIYAIEPSSADKGRIISAPPLARFITHVGQYGVGPVAIGCTLSPTMRSWCLQLYPPGPVQQGIGLLLGILGFVILAWGKAQLGQHFSPCYKARVPTGLVDTGLYGWVRHPLYSAAMLGLLGVCLFTSSLVLIATAIIVVFTMRRCAMAEEEALSGTFPAYKAYMHSTGRFFPKLVHAG